MIARFPIVATKQRTVTEFLNSDSVTGKLTKVDISQQYYNPEGDRVRYYSGRLHVAGLLFSFGVPQGFSSGVLEHPCKQRCKACHTSTLAL